MAFTEIFIPGRLLQAKLLEEKRFKLGANVADYKALLMPPFCAWSAIVACLMERVCSVISQQTSHHTPYC